jgi:type I restriction enzyme R subunit
LSKYIETGVEELEKEKLPTLLQKKYHSINDATDLLGGIGKNRNTLINFQKYLCEHKKFL